jgi:hypothetical protein
LRRDFADISVGMVFQASLDVKAEASAVLIP